MLVTAPLAISRGTESACAARSKGSSISLPTRLASKSRLSQEIHGSNWRYNSCTCWLVWLEEWNKSGMELQIRCYKSMSIICFSVLVSFSLSYLSCIFVCAVSATENGDISGAFSIPDNIFYQESFRFQILVNSRHALYVVTFSKLETVHDSRHVWPFTTELNHIWISWSFSNVHYSILLLPSTAPRLPVLCQSSKSVENILKAAWRIALWQTVSSFVKERVLKF